MFNYTYPDTVLFIIGGVLASVALVTIMFLLVFRKRSRVYAEFLRQGTETYNPFAAAGTNGGLVQKSTQYETSKGRVSTATLYGPQNGRVSKSTFYSGTSGSQNRHTPTSTLYGNTTGTPAIHTGTEELPYDNPQKSTKHDSIAKNHETMSTERILTHTQHTGETASPRSFDGGFDPSVIAPAYTVVQEIGGGAMSRTFIVRSAKLGNEWFLKYVPKNNGRLASEENILKHLNHPGLPRIVDVFYGDGGTYLVQALVAGTSLERLLRQITKISQHVLLEWFEQIAQALNYLHSMRPSPILHLDLKPGNLMVTHDNRLVLVDFGISRRFGESAASSAVTVKYAAPEQFGGAFPKKYANILGERFGRLPAGFGHRAVDARTDIYSLGVIMYELATGQMPTQKNVKTLKKHVSSELYAVIAKCLDLDPAKRYPSAEKLLADLQKAKGANVKMARSLLARRFAGAFAALCLAASAGFFAVGFNVLAIESAATISSRPDVITLSVRQYGIFELDRHMPNGDVVMLYGDQVRWAANYDNIAHIEGNRITGMNIGQTYLVGSHRNGDVVIDVRVVEPMGGVTEISQRYLLGRSVSVFAGSFGRDSFRTDGNIAEMDFFSPESISAAPDGSLYFTDAGVIRRIQGGMSETLRMPDGLFFLTADMVRHSGEGLFFLTAPWIDLYEREVFAIARMDENDVLFLKVFDARHAAVEDFAFMGGRLYFIERNAGLGAVFLRSLNPDGTGDIRTLYRLPEGSTSLAASGSALYIGNTALGSIQVFMDGELRNFAGLAGDRAFIDGASPKFYSPQRLEYFEGGLYVWDFNSLRRIPAKGFAAGEAMSIAGRAYPAYEAVPQRERFNAEDIVLPHGRLMDFAVTQGGIFITDHKRGVLWRVDNK